MQFLVIGQDGTDSGAMDRRAAARPAHVALGNQLRAEGKHLYDVAILHECDQMIGSVLVTEFADNTELVAWLTVEPYIMGKVWERIEVRPCRVGPSFVTLRSRP